MEAVSHSRFYNLLYSRGLKTEFGQAIYSKAYLGDYPPAMKAAVEKNSKAELRASSRLPQFTAYERELLKGGCITICRFNSLLNMSFRSSDVSR